MKKIKMMLLSLALFAVVGGALAFKARFQFQFCTAPTIAGVPNTDLSCPNHVINSTFDPTNQTIFVATTTYDGNDCQTPELKCTTTSKPLITNE